MMAFLGNIQRDKIVEVAQMPRVNPKVTIEPKGVEVSEHEWLIINSYINEVVDEVLVDLETSESIKVYIIPGAGGSFNPDNNCIDIGFDHIKPLINNSYPYYNPSLDLQLAHEMFHQVQFNLRNSNELEEAKLASYLNRTGKDTLKYLSNALEFEANLFAIVFVQNRLERLRQIQGFNQEKDYTDELSIRRLLIDRSKSFAIPISQISNELIGYPTDSLLYHAGKWIIKNWESMRGDQKTVENIERLIKFLKNPDGNDSYFFDFSKNSERAILFYRDVVDRVEDINKFLESLKLNYLAGIQNPFRKEGFNYELNSKFLSYGFLLRGDFEVTEKNAVNFNIQDFQGIEYEISAVASGVSIRLKNEGEIIDKSWAQYLAKSIHSIFVDYR